ncbi:DUF1810 domain-containing protein [Sphingomonas sp. MMS12-HWE2-04]|uniref:DUF1810 domain-containing protein n=1 Tax=Sphingomonas sp. MMS12-HWE2-04 TaxID=3234199 RepID=UPI00384FEDAE
MSLERFVEAQAPAYATAIAEIRRGAKRSHWMWFVFPQLRGLGRSETAQFFGVDGREEAAAYLDHPLLGPRYVACVEALQDLALSDPETVFGAVDAMKLRSSLTLFEAVRPNPLFAAAIERWFGGDRDRHTLSILGR